MTRCGRSADASRSLRSAAETSPTTAIGVDEQYAAFEL